MYVVFKVDQTRPNKFSFSIHICASAAAVLQSDIGGSEVLTRRKAKRSGKDGERQLGRIQHRGRRIQHRGRRIIFCLLLLEEPQPSG